MIRITGKPITTSKKSCVLVNTATKNKNANKKILIGIQEEQRRQNQCVSYGSLGVMK